MNIIKKIIPMKLKIRIKSTRLYKRYRGKQILKGRNNTKVFSNSSKMKVLFIIQRIEVFTSSLPIFNECIKRGYDVSLLALVRYFDSSNSFDFESQKKVLDYIKTLNVHNVKVIQSYNFDKKDYNSLVEIYDYIFINMPYKSHYPKNFDFQNLRMHGKLCLITYGYHATENQVLFDCISNKDILENINYYFCTSIVQYDYVKSLLKYAETKEGKQIVYNLGFPRFELLDNTNYINPKQTILWTPRWTDISNNKDNLAGSFLKYKDDFLNYAKHHKELDFIIRPHPLMFNNYLACGVLSKEDYKSLIKEIDESENITLDQTPYYLDSFKKATILLTDYSSIVIEFYIQNKPIIYTGKMNDFSKDLAHMANSFYLVNKFDDIENIIDKLVNNIDTKKELREVSIKTFWKTNKKNASEHILNLLETEKFKQEK